MKAIILLSGGIDSTVMLALAHQQQKKCLALSFDYGQRHRVELQSAKVIASHYQVSHYVISLNNTTFVQSALINPSSTILKDRTWQEIASSGTPNTYVPARNTLFLAYALGFAEVTGAEEIHFGANLMDINPYPDCRPAFFNAFQSLFNLATKQAVEGHPPRLITPLLEWNKTTIIAEGLRLGAPLEHSFSCYAPAENNGPCHHCDACILREEGFNQARGAIKSERFGH